MIIPIRYTLRNLWTRKLTTVLTAGGMALVVFVFAAVQMLDTGLRETLVATGQPDNVLVTRRGGGRRDLERRSTACRPRSSNPSPRSRSGRAGSGSCRRRP